MDELSLPTKIRVIDRAVLYDELDTRATHERKTNTAMTIREITPTLRCKNVLERFVGPRIRHQKERHLSGRRKRITRQQFLAMIDAQSPKPITVSSPDAETSQLHATLLDLYMPESGGDQISFRSFLDVASSNEALSSAATALSLLLVGRAENDLRILFAASTYCSGALQKAYQEVGSPGTTKCIVFGIALILSEYDAIQKAPLIDSTTNSHARYLLAFMNQCCADLRAETDTHNKLPKGLWQSHHRLVAALDTLGDRVCPYRIASLEYYSEMQPADEVAAFAVLTLCTSALLESIDAFCRRDEQISKACVLDILQDCIQIERELHTRMAGYYAELTYLPFWYVDSASFAYGGRHRISALVRKAYAFIDISAAMIHIAYWMCLLSLIEAQLTLSHNFPDAFKADDVDVARLDKLRKEFTDNIVMSIPYLGEAKNGWAGRTTAMRPLHFLLARFKERCEWQGASWCVAMLKSLGSEGHRDSYIDNSADPPVRGFLVR